MSDVLKFTFHLNFSQGDESAVFTCNKLIDYTDKNYTLSTIVIILVF